MQLSGEVSVAQSLLFVFYAFPFFAHGIVILFSTYEFECPFGKLCLSFAQLKEINNGKNGHVFCYFLWGAQSELF